MNEIERELLDAHRAVVDGQAALDAAIEHRAIAFGLAAERGLSSGDIARLTGATVNQVMHAIRVGRGLIRFRRARRERHEELAA